ncbi:GNAT family N-acetyltransferase [Lamprocystis purpurea]|jgi:RimJ/RimL family protein N-acetyltransferase|uniref:GNAT family N-acetyltransferase n=1 Tax=Lamprocystis purpurea TaxID=61598 RepID=UPI0003743244|nr:GNAT family N-acetyltransferase [Lamprocystis purpurea]
MYEPHLVEHETNHINPAPQALNLRIRPSGAADRERLKACFGALSPESRRLRFFASKPNLNDAELDLFSNADGWDHIAVAAVRLDDQGRETETLGFARCIRLAPGGDCAEFSITVADAAHGQGIGTAMSRQLLELARAAGVRHLRFEVLAENTPMRKLALAIGGKPDWTGDGIVEYDCELLPSVNPHRSLPWFASPHRLLSAYVDLWLASLDRGLHAARTAQQGFAHWLDQVGGLDQDSPDA